MKNIIKNYINTLNRNDINTFAKNNNINLNNTELEFIYNFIKTRYNDILDNPNNFSLTKYRSHFTNENFIKINGLINKYRKYLN